GGLQYGISCCSQNEGLNSLLVTESQVVATFLTAQKAAVAVASLSPPTVFATKLVRNRPHCPLCVGAEEDCYARSAIGQDGRARVVLVHLACVGWTLKLAHGTLGQRKNCLAVDCSAVDCSAVDCSAVDCSAVEC